MKKIVFVTIAFILLCFSIPMIFTNKNKTKEIVIEKEPEYEYKKYKTVKLLHESTGEIEMLGIDQYLLRSSFSRNAGKI